MKKILLIFTALAVLIMASCSGSPDVYNPSPVSAAPDEFSQPGYAVEADGYTFFTDFKSVYRMDNKTGDTTKIFTSDDDIFCIMEYSGYLFVQFYVANVYRMDFNGNDITQFEDMNLIFGADGYIYYDKGGGDINRRTVSGDKDEYIFDWYSETNGANDIGFWSNRIGYYKGKVYFQQNHEIFTLSKDGVKIYYCDGNFHSMKGPKIILKKEEAFYSRDVDTGYEFKVYSYKGKDEDYRSGEYIGEYNNNEYYLTDGYILTSNINGDKSTQRGSLPFNYVEYAAISNEWIYIDSIAESPGFFRYNIVTKQKEPIAAFPEMPGTIVTECNNHLYYVTSDETGLFRIDLNDNSIKQIYSGKMYVYHLYI